MPASVAIYISRSDESGISGRLIGPGKGSESDAMSAGKDICLREEVLPVLPGLAMQRSDDRGMVPTLISTERLIPSLNVGDVVVGEAVGVPSRIDPENYRSGADIPALQFYGEPEILGRVADPAESILLVSEYVRLMSESGKRISNLYLSSTEDMDYTACFVASKYQPNQALIAAWLSDEGRVGKTLLVSRGHMLFAESAAGDVPSDLIGDPPGPGIWILKDGRPWSATDWETGFVDSWGLEGPLHEISLADGAEFFGESETKLLADLDEAYPYIIDGGLTVIEALRLPAGARTPEEARQCSPS